MLKHTRSNKQQLPLTPIHLEVLENAMDAGEGGLDTSAVIQDRGVEQPGSLLSQARQLACGTYREPFAMPKEV